MKKIIVFLSMFLFAGGILMAQTPKLSYEVLLRDDANNLLYEQSPVNVHVSIFDKEGTTSLYDEDVTGLSTDANALLQIGFGEGVDWEAAGVDWSRARISLNIDCNGRTITQDVPVYAVPYALKAANVPEGLTTDEIIEYLGKINFEDDARRILRAVHENPNGLEDDFIDSLINYGKAHKDIAKDVLLHYVDVMTAENVQSTYDNAINNTNAYERGRVLSIEYMKNHMQDVIDIAAYFINNYTIAEDEHYVEDFVAKVKANTEVYSKVKAYFEDIFKEYLDDHHYIQKADCTDVDPCTIH